MTSNSCAVPMGSLHGVVTYYFYVDINECEDMFYGGCDQICNNTNGSFECSCNTGFESSSDGFLCLGEENNSQNLNYHLLLRCPKSLEVLLLGSNL